MTSKIDKELESQEFKGPLNIRNTQFEGSILNQIKARDGIMGTINGIELMANKEFTRRSMSKTYIKSIL